MFERSTVTAARTESPSARTAKGRGGKPARFIRESVSEMRKVLWPSRSELITDGAVVIVFVVVMTALVSGLDLGLSKLVVEVFS
jgi:preprotein translocase subunit SecE